MIIAFCCAMLRDKDAKRNIELTKELTMPEVETLRCPNCGAMLKDKRVQKCDFCGAVLLYPQTEERLLPEEKKRPDGSVSFLHLADVPINIKTTDIPFKPRIKYHKLPGGEPGPALKEDADRICALFEKLQQAVNRKDLETYMSFVSEQNREYYNGLREFLIKQFQVSDLKRLTLSLAFISLSASSAVVDITYEGILFRPNGSHSGFWGTVRVILGKINDEWKVISSAPRIPLSFLRKLPCWIQIVILLALIGGFVWLCWFIFRVLFY